MIKFENTEVMGWEHAIRGMRNPMNSWEKSDSGWFSSYPSKEHVMIIEEDAMDYFIGPNDLALMKKLRNAGTDHRKFMRMITVYVDITAPLYFFKEFDTYRVGVTANSCSTMHKIADKEFTLDDFSHEHLQDCELTGVDGFVDGVTPMTLLNATVDLLNYYRKCFIEDGKSKDDWWQMIQLLPSSYNQKRTVQLNYEVLANIYKSRRNHKLDEWSIGFMDWIKTLPYSELITGEGGK